MPTAFCGLYSIRPSSGRLSFKNVANSVSSLPYLWQSANPCIKSPGQQVIPTVVGLMGDSVSCLQIVLRSIQSMEPWLHDPDVVEIPWRSDKEISSNADASKVVTFGLFADDGLVAPHPPIQRAVKMVENALRACKYQVCGRIRDQVLH